MSDLKDILHAVFSEAAPKAYGGYWQSVSTDTSSDHYDLGGSVNADRLAQAIRDHVFDREKVRAALLHAFGPTGSIKFHGRQYVSLNVDGSSSYGEITYDPESEKIIDRLIEGLAGKVGEL